MHFAQCDLGATVHDKFHENNNHDIIPTDINPNSEHTCTTVDVRINDGSFPGNQAGYWECHNWNSGSPLYCQEGHVHMDTDAGNIPENPNFTEMIVCEEIGHSVGLDHSDGTNSCMNSTSLHLGGHDINVINSVY